MYGKSTPCYLSCWDGKENFPLSLDYHSKAIVEGKVKIKFLYFGGCGS